MAKSLVSCFFLTHGVHLQSFTLILQLLFLQKTKIVTKLHWWLHYMQILYQLENSSIFNLGQITCTSSMLAIISLTIIIMIYPA